MHVSELLEEEEEVNDGHDGVISSDEFASGLSWAVSEECVDSSTQVRSRLLRALTAKPRAVRRGLHDK